MITFEKVRQRAESDAKRNGYYLNPDPNYLKNLLEGLKKNGKLHPLQAAFIQNNALQCGHCTPGMILGAYALLLGNPEPSARDIIDGMEGNLCRCGSYNRIIQAIQTAARAIRGETS